MLPDLKSEISATPLQKKADEKIITRIPPKKWITWLIISYGFEGLDYIITGTFIVAIADQTKSIRFNSAIIWIVVGFAAIFSCIIWSTLAKKWGYVKTLVIAMFLQAVGIALPVFSLTETSFIISALLFGGTFMGITTIATTLGRLINPMNSSKIIGILTAVYALGQMIGPTIGGIVVHYTKSFQLVLHGAAFIVFLGGMLLVSGIRFERRKNKMESSA